MEPSSIRTRILLFCTLLVVAVTVGATDPEVSGHWEGTIQAPGEPLEVMVDLVPGPEGLGGTISIPRQGARDLPLERVELTGRELRFAISGVPGEPEFAGTVTPAGGRVEGTFTQGGATLPFSLERSKAPSARAAEALEDLEALVERALEDFVVPSVAIAVVVDGETILSNGYGTRDVAEGLPATSQTLYAIGSSTKAFTALALGSLVDEGVVDWDTPVVDLLPEFRLADDHTTLHLTVRDLLTHRSGLPRHDLVWYNAPYNRQDLVQRLRFLEPFRDLREEWAYQNLMYLTAGVVLEELTATPWEQSVRERLLEPLGMDRSNFSVDVSREDPDHALPYREEDGDLVEIPFRAITTMGPAGSINSTADDMARWLQLQLGSGQVDKGRVVSELVVRETHTPQMTLGRYPEDTQLLLTSYGLGWFLHSYRGHYQVEHGGNIDGFSALVTLMPLDGCGVVVLSNANATPLPRLLTRHILDRLLDLEPHPWLQEALEKRRLAEAEEEDAEARKAELRVEGTRPSHPLADYVGRYEHPGYGVITIEEQDGRLQLELHDITAPLEHWHYDVFVALRNESDPTFEDHKISFRTDLRGAVEALVATMDPLVDPIVFRRLPDQRLRDPDYLERFAGSYELTGETLQIHVQGDALVLTVPGQPPYTLEPVQGTEFVLEKVRTIGVRFVVDDGGGVAAMELLQPDGLYTAEKLEE